MANTPDLNENVQRARDLAAELSNVYRRLDEIGKKNISLIAGEKDLVKFVSETVKQKTILYEQTERLINFYSDLLIKSKAELNISQMRQELAAEFGEKLSTTVATNKILLENAQELLRTMWSQYEMLSEMDIKTIEQKLANKELLKILQQLTKELIEHPERLEKIKEGIIEATSAMQSFRDMTEAAQSMAATAAAEVVKPFDKVADFIKGLPGGNIIAEYLQLDTVSKNLTTSFESAFNEFFTTGRVNWAKFGADIKTVWGKVMSAIASKTFLIIAGITALIALVTAAINRFVEIDKLTRSIRKETGFTGESAAELAEYAEKTELQYANLGIDLENASEIASALVDTFGSTAFLTEQNTASMARLVGVLGMGAGEAADLLKTFKNIAVTTGDSADNLIATTMEFAKQSKVAPKAVLDDIANSSQTIFEYTNGSAETIARTAVEARKLGINLSIVEGIASNLMDFESSIQSEMEAMVITGRALNLEQARYFAMTGETDKMLKSITQQIGSAEELSRMMPYEQQALAKAIGISVYELRNMALQQEINQGLAEGTLSTWEALQKGASLKEALGEDAMTTLENIGLQFKYLGVQLATMLLPLIKLLAPALNVVLVVLKPIVTLAELLGKGVDMIAKSVNYLAGLWTKMWSAIGNFLGIEDALGGLQKSFSGLGNVIKTLGDIWNVVKDAAIVGLGAIAAAFIFSNPVGWIVGIIGALGILWKHWDTIWGDIKAVTKDFVEFISKLFGGDFIASISGIVGFLSGIGTAIFNAITWPFRAAVDFIGDLIGVDIGSAIGSMVNYIEGVAGDLFITLTKPFVLYFNFVKNIIGNIIDLFSGEISFSEFLSNSFGNVITLLKGIAVSIFDIITWPFRTAVGFIGNLVGVDILGFISSAFGGIFNFIAGIGGNLIDIITKPFILGFNLIKNVINNTVGFLTGEISFTDLVSGIFGSILDFVGGIGKTIFNVITWPFRAAWDWITGESDAEGKTESIFSSILGFLGGIGKTIFNVITWPYRTAWDFISGLFSGDTISSVFSSILGFISNAVVSIFDLITFPFRSAVDMIKNIFNSLVAFFTGEISFTDMLLSAFGSVIDFLAEIGNAIFDVITWPFRAAWDWLFGHTLWSADTITGVFSQILDALSAIFNGIFDIVTLPFQLAFEKISSIIGSIIDGVSDIVSGVGKFLGFGGEEAKVSVETTSPVPPGAAAAVAAAAAPVPTTQVTIGGTELSTKDIVSKLEEILQALKEGKIIMMDGRKVGENIARASVTH